MRISLSKMSKITYIKVGLFYFKIKKVSTGWVIAISNNDKDYMFGFYFKYLTLAIKFLQTYGDVILVP